MTHDLLSSRPRRRRVPLGVLGLAFLALLLVGCLRGSTSEKPPIHPNPNMDRQPKLLAQQKSEFFYDGKTMRSPVPGTVARGKLRENPALFSGKSGWGYYLNEVPYETLGAEENAFLARGAERYAIYCTPCHGAQGDGQGMLFTKGGVKTANLLEAKFRDMQSGKIYETITRGKGLMPSYKYPIPMADRWAIAAHVKKLQGEAEATP